MTNRLRLLSWLFAALFLAAHLRTLPRTLEDIDSINFALGVEDYNVDAHRPHPPGYPVYIALAKISTAAVHVIAPSWDRNRAAAAGLSLLSVIAGSFAIFALTRLWLALGFSPALAFFAALLAAVSPLFWFTAARPLTDTPGLVAAIAVQAALLRGLRGRRASFLTARGEPLQLSHALSDPQSPGLKPEAPSPTPRYWLLAGLAGGFIVGLRSQTMWLTGPLMLWCVWELARRRRMGDALRLVGGAAGGALLWAIPMVWATGGFSTYLDALSRMGSADFSDIEMLSKTPTWALFQLSMSRTFIEPWLRPALAGVVLLLAMAGAARLLGRRAPALALIALAFVPYLVFHLLFHETVTGRYGLPLVVPVAGLAVAALITLHARITGAIVTVLAVASLVVVQPAMSAYARDSAPVMHGLRDIAVAGASAPAPPRLLTHHQVWHGVQRGLLWEQPVWDPGPVPFPVPDCEWLEIEKPWLTGDTRTVWLLADLTRTDVALFDPRARALRGRYEIDHDLLKFTKSLRLDSFNWWAIDRPGWMLGTGWSLTGESAGVMGANKPCSNTQSAEAWILRRPVTQRVLVGGRYVGAFQNATAPPAILSIELDGRPAAQWTIVPEPIWFVQWFDLPATAPDAASPYARLTIRALPSAAGQRAPVMQFEQFDAAPADVPSVAFLADWNEQEQDKTGKQWRWTTARSTIEVKGVSRDLVLDVSGESPLKQFGSAPEVIVRAGNQELARFQPAADFVRHIPLPAAALAASAGRVTIETNQTFSPHERDTSVADTRRLGLKLFEVTVR